MKKIVTLTMAAVMALSLTACASNAQPDQTGDPQASEAGSRETMAESADAPESIKVTTLNGSGEKIEIEVPYNPQKIAVMDLSGLDILDNLDLSDRIVGVPKSISIDYLQEYVNDDNLVNLGTVKEADMEALMASEPDVIITGGRMANIYDELSKIAPVILLSIDSEIGVLESTRVNAKSIASMFGMEDSIDSLMAEYDGRITALQANAEGKTAVVGMVNAGGFSVLGNDGRCSIIGKEIGFQNIGVDAGADTATHGNEASFELLVEVNPDYIFIMDRDAAIGTEGAKLAPEVMDNELIQMTAASQNDRIVYLEHSNVWYTAEGGITALDIMLSDLESQLMK